MRLYTEAVTIADNASLSNAIDLQSRLLRAIILPTGWVTADIAFQAATSEGGTYYDVVDWDGTRWVTGGAAEQLIVIRTELGAALPWVKIESVDTAAPGTPVSQTGGPLELSLITEARPS